MTTYRLPDALGGGEVEVLHGFARDDGRVDCNVPGVGVVAVPAKALVEVKPPLPPEPPVGSLVHLSNYYGVFERLDYGWLLAGEAAGRGRDWETLLRLNSGNAPVRLVPDPFAEPVELPWESSPRGQPHEPIMRSSVRVRSNVIEDANDAGSHSVAVHFLPNDARQKARALWAAADAVEAKR